MCAIRASAASAPDENLVLAANAQRAICIQHRAYIQYQWRADEFENDS